jgi:hypothetical protein
MYGPGLAPPPQRRRPSTAELVVLRVIFVALPILTIGMLCWAGQLRVAFLTRKKTDWALFWAEVAAVVGAIVLVGIDDEDITWRADLGVLMLIAFMVAPTSYYLFAEMRHFDPRRYEGLPATPPAGVSAAPPALGVPRTDYPPHSGYGYPHHSGPSVPGPAPHSPPHLARQGPYATTSPMPDGPGPVGGIPGPAHPPAPAPYATPAPMAPAQSGQGAHGRIDQVRAELDELSDYLRRQPDEPPHSQEGRAPEGGTL